MKDIIRSYERGDEVLFSREDALLSDLSKMLDEACKEDVRDWALEMVRKPLSYLKGRYSSVYGLESFMDGGKAIEEKTAYTVWKKLMRAENEAEDRQDKLMLKSAAAFLKTTWDKDYAMDAMVLLLSSIIWQDGLDEGVRGVPIVVFAAEEILERIIKKIA